MGGWSVLVYLAVSGVGALAFLHVSASEVDRTTRILIAHEAYEKRKEERRRAVESDEKTEAA